MSSFLSLYRAPQSTNSAHTSSWVSKRRWNQPLGTQRFSASWCGPFSNDKRHLCANTAKKTQWHKGHQGIEIDLEQLEWSGCEFIQHAEIRLVETHFKETLRQLFAKGSKQ